MITISRDGTRTTNAGLDSFFSGSVLIEKLADAKEPSQVTVSRVTFQPGARTAWHTHPSGQHLIIASGTGWVQEEGRPKEIVRVGDVVWFPPNVKHWHGATDTTGMSHYSIQEVVDGSPVTWMEHVTDEQYG